MSNKNLYLGAAILVAVLLVGGYLLGQRSFQNQQSKTLNSSPVSVTPSAVNKDLITYDCELGESAYDILSRKTKVKSEEHPSLGKLITAINGKEQGGGKYWTYLVDGKVGTVSASKYVCQGEEKITWELQ
ncbi:DUF4430 domain-containing protein [Candidatus Daviesbacteria bacterium]|nr:DUF4430 domain-containing protein [Candidatus Daviesbacteria bacterium]